MLNFGSSMTQGKKHSRPKMLILGVPSGLDARHLPFALVLVRLQPAAGISLVSLAPQLNDFQYFKNGIPKASDLL